MKVRILVALACSAMAAACSSEGGTAPTPNLGSAVHHNMAVHILPVPPSNVPGAPTDMPGPRASVQIDRYMSGKVTPLYSGVGGASAGPEITIR